MWCQKVIKKGILVMLLFSGFFYRQLWLVNSINYYLCSVTKRLSMPRETLESNNQMDLCDFITYFYLNFQFRDLYKMNKDMKTSSYENDDGLFKDLKSCYLHSFLFFNTLLFCRAPLATFLFMQEQDKRIIYFTQWLMQLGNWNKILISFHSGLVNCLGP